MKKLAYVSLTLLFISAIVFGLKKNAVSQSKTNTVKLVLTTNDVKYIIDCLEEKPYKESAGLINNIITQTYTQNFKDTPDTTHHK